MEGMETLSPQGSLCELQLLKHDEQEIWTLAEESLGVFTGYMHSCRKKQHFFTMTFN